MSNEIGTDEIKVGTHLDISGKGSMENFTIS